MKIFSIILMFLFSACDHYHNEIKTGASIIVKANSSSLTYMNGSLFNSGKPFTGTVKEFFENGTLHQSTQYVDGKEDGWKMTWFPKGMLSEKRYYTKGEKDSVHTGWWNNGNKRFEYHFTSGSYNGDFKEWYRSGQQMKHIHYSNGNDDQGIGWRENGKVYMNFIVKNGRRYGLNNSNLCYTVLNGSGEFVRSTD
jgi:antitoxin component YwqK of YwqJK toxin-antitoxin module